jgi:hypothetical protein
MNSQFDAQDFALRTLIVIAGALAAAWFALNGEAQALPGLAIGGTIGAFFMARLSATEE